MKRIPLPVILIGALLTVLAIAYLGPSILVHHKGSLTAAERLKATSDARTSLAQVIAAVGLFGGLTFTARTYLLSRVGQITDRYQAGVRQLGDDSRSVRIGGIYALEQLAKEERSTQQTIWNVLASFIHETAKQHDPSWRRHLPVTDSDLTGDVQAALTVLGRPGRDASVHPANLSATVLTGADLQRAQLDGTLLRKTRLERANFTDATLDRAVLRQAILRRANLSGTSLRGADLTEADLRGATLYRADFADATLTRCRLTGCDLSTVRNFTCQQRRDAKF